MQLIPSYDVELKSPGPQHASNRMQHDPNFYESITCRNGAFCGSSVSNHPSLPNTLRYAPFPPTLFLVVPRIDETFDFNRDSLEPWMIVCLELVEWLTGATCRQIIWKKCFSPSNTQSAPHSMVCWWWNAIWSAIFLAFKIHSCWGVDKFGKNLYCNSNLTTIDTQIEVGRVAHCVLKRHERACGRIGVDAETEHDFGR